MEVIEAFESAGSLSESLICAGMKVFGDVLKGQSVTKNEMFPIFNSSLGRTGDLGWSERKYSYV